MITLTDIQKSFGKGEAAVHALRGVSLTIAENEMIAIMGKSGCGKSTLLNIISGLLTADAGEYCYKKTLMQNTPKQFLPFRRNTVGIVLQYFALLDDRTVYDNIALALRYHGLSKKEVKDKVAKALELLEISDKSKAYPSQLSGGQQQRVAIARAMVKDPDIILADEPTGALDEETGEIVMGIFKAIHALGKTIVLVTHDENIASQCQRTIYMKDGQITTPLLE